MHIARGRRDPERGAILLHVAIGIVVLIGFLTFVVDYGVMWVARGQAQNAADAGRFGRRRGDGIRCQRVDESERYRTRTHGGPPDGGDQLGHGTGARRRHGDRCLLHGSARRHVPCRCERPDRVHSRGRLSQPGTRQRSAIALRPSVRDHRARRPRDGDGSRRHRRLERLLEAVGDSRQVDRQLRRDASDERDSATVDRGGSVRNRNAAAATRSRSRIRTSMFHRRAAALARGSRSPRISEREWCSKHGSPQSSLSPGVFQPVRIPRYDGASQGGADYSENIASCAGMPVGIGDTLESENGNMIGPTRHGRRRSHRPGSQRAMGSSDEFGDRTAVPRRLRRAGEVLASSPSPSSTPRPTTPRSVRDCRQFTIVNILGFFIDRMQGNDVVGYLTEAPGLVRGATAPIDPSASFLAQIQLIR